MYTFNRIAVLAIIVASALYSVTSAQTANPLQPRRTVFVAADFAGLPGYTGTVAIDADVMFSGWLGIRAGVGTSYALYEGTASGFSVALKLMTPPREENPGRLEVHLGGSYVKINYEGSDVSGYEWLPLLSIGGVVEITGHGAPVAVFGRAGLGFFYYFGTPFYIGWGVAF